MKKILIIATAILIFILILIATLTSFMKRGGNTGQTAAPTPTTAPYDSSFIDQVADQELLDAAISFSPYEAEGFSYDYSPDLNKVVVSEKTPQGYEEFIDWTNEIGLPELAGNPNIVIFESYNGTLDGTDSSNGSGTNLGVTPTPSINPMIEFLNIFLNFGQGVPIDGSISPTPTEGPSSNNPSPTSNSLNRQSLTYYAQCNRYGNTHLPSGCNLCEAGCGPTTVAMIASSYLGIQYNPKAVVDLYEKNGYYLSCAGSRYSDAKSLLEKLGLKTTSYIIYDSEKSDAVFSDFKKYIDAGWTIFTLANYCDGGCGHFFWVTSVKDGNILAYDPYYGKSTTPPINENSRYPYPKYRLAFGVKK